MRILNVADFNWVTGAERHTVSLSLFDLCRKLSLAATRANHLVVEYSDRAVARTHAPLGARALGRGPANRRFLQMVDELRPDLILLHFADQLSDEALTEARKLAPGVVIADVNINSIALDKTRRRMALRRGLVDALFVTTAEPELGRYAGGNAFAAYLPNMVDPSVETGRAFQTAALAFDLLLPARGDFPRQIGEGVLTPAQAIARLVEGAPGVRINAPGVERPSVGGVAYLDALASARMGWALSRTNDLPLHASDRMAHMFGWGLTTFLDRRAGFERFYGADEAGFYDDMDGLTAAVRGFLVDDDRARAVARRGWEKTWTLFDSGRVLTYMLAQLFDEGGASGYEWPTDRWRS